MHVAIILPLYTSCVSLIENYYMCGEYYVWNSCLNTKCVFIRWLPSFISRSNQCGLLPQYHT